MANLISGISHVLTNSSGGGTGGNAVLSGNGRYVVFTSNSFDPVTLDANGLTNNSHVYLRDLLTGQLSRIDLLVFESGGFDISASGFDLGISGSGRYIVYVDQNGFSPRQVLVRDTLTNALLNASTSAAGTPGNGDSGDNTGSGSTIGYDLWRSISENGRYVVFASDATNLVAGDTNGVTDVFVKDLVTNAITRVSQSAAEEGGNWYSYRPSISADGRYVIFQSSATNLVAATSGYSEGSIVGVYLWDMTTSAITALTLSTPTGAVNGAGSDPAMTPDARYVVFDSQSGFLAGDTNGQVDIYCLDRMTGSYVLVSTAANGMLANAGSSHPSISDNGRYVVFSSEASNLVAGDGNDIYDDIFVKDLVTGAIARVNVSAAGAEANSFSFTPIISGDGHYILFTTNASNLLTLPGQQHTLMTLNPLWVQPSITGTEGADNLPGTAGDDLIRGLGGNDVLNGGLGNDTMEGGLGNDTYVRNAAGDVITELASQGTDTVQSAIAYTLLANLERLTLTGSGNVNGTGNGANNVLTGNAGNNVLNGGTGNDTMAGGAGNDTYVRNTAGDVVTELANQGNDLVQSAVTYTLPVNVERLTLTGAGHINATGNGGNNTLSGNAGNNILNGIAGNDTMAGGLGNDTYVRNVAGDVVTEAAGQGNDLVQTAVTYTLGANLERLTLTGTGNINGTGNVLANVINGNAGNNVLDGVGGADTLNGLGGNDTLVWHATDTLVDGGVGSDTLRINGANQTLNLLTVANTKIVNVEVINLTGTGNNRLELSLQDVLDLSTSTNTLRVDGNAGDTVDRNAGWAQGANQVIGANTYRSYTQGAATLLVDTDITSVT